MRRGQLIVVLVLTLFIVSCAQLRKGIIEISEEDIKNAETTRTVAKNLLVSWPINSGFIKGALGEKINELPVSVFKAIQELDNLARRKDELTDHDLGYSVGLRIRMLSAIVQQAIKEYAPEIVKYIPTLFAL